MPMKRQCNVPFDFLRPWIPDTTMARVQQIILFGDQTEDFGSLRPLLTPNRAPLLESFLQNAVRGLRTEIAFLPLQDRQQYPYFPTVASVLDWRIRQQKAYPAIDSALTCINQLAQFIQQVPPLTLIFTLATLILTLPCSQSPEHRQYLHQPFKHYHRWSLSRLFICRRRELLSDGLSAARLRHTDHPSSVPDGLARFASRTSH